MSKLLDPYKQLDFSKGRITKYSMSALLTPENSVANAINVDFSEVIGSAIVRKGKQQIQQLVGINLLGQHQDTIDNQSNQTYGVNWTAQTFIPTTGQTPLTGIVVGLKRTGSPTSVVMALYNTSAGNPTTLITSQAIDPASIPTTSFGGAINIPITPFRVLTPGTTYALVLIVVGDGSNYVTWDLNTAGGYGSGQALASTNSGSTWAAAGTGDFNFAVYYLDPVNAYNLFPVGLWAGIINKSAKSVVVYRETLESQRIWIFYHNGVNWVPSDFASLDSSVPVRFVVLNGSIFEANGIDTMHSSADYGANWVTTNCITTDSVKPSLLAVSKNRMLAAGYSAYPSRVYFSSIINPSTSPFITWNTDASDGDWIDINPDDGGIVTGFGATSNLALVFKNGAMYRLNTINKTVDSENIFNVGAVSQEAIASCLGLTYFYSGNGIYRTDGGFPDMISRWGVQDFIDAISDPTQVFAGTDGLNITFSIGNITLTLDDNVTRTFTNVVLKFSPRDESWSIFSYPERLGNYAQFGLVPAVKLISAQYNGFIADINSATPGDDGRAVHYELESQELPMGNRATTKVISDKVVVYTKSGTEGSFQIRGNSEDFTPVNVSLNDRINVASNVNVIGEYFTFKWMGEVKGTRPILQGLYLPNVTDQGITK